MAVQGDRPVQTTDKAPQHAYERAMQKVLERGSSMLAYWDSDQRCCFASKAYARWFGVDPQGLIGASIKDVLGPTLFALDELQILAALRGEEQISQRTILCPDGVQRQSLAHCLPDIVDGDVLGFVAQVTDVTSLKEAETALHAEAVDPGRPGDRLRKSEATLRQAQRLLRIGSWHWEASPDISTWSEELYRIFGRDPARLPPAYAEHGQLYTAQSWPVLQAAVAQTLVHGDPFILAWHTLASGERYVSPRFSHQRLDLAAEQAFDWETQRVLLPDGRYGVVCYFHEITARQQAERALRESEEHLRLATATTGVGIWEWDAAGGQIRWDAQMFRIFGIEPTFDGGVPAETWIDCVVMEDRARLDESLQGTVRKLGAASREFRIRRLNDGQLRTIESVETVRADAQGKVQWVVGTNLDVTAQRQMEAELNLSARRKDEFLATLAHELRNPLAPVKNSLALMKRANGDAGLLEQARATMERQVAQMVRLIDDLVDVSRITLDKLTLTLERIDLASVVHLAVETCQPHCEREGQALRVVLPPQPVHLHADQARLAQVLGNLLNNASKYTPAGGCIELIAETHG